MTGASAPGIVDLHCHVLPGVDDGSPDLETSLSFLRASRACGVTDVVATPHQHPGRYPNEPAPLREAHARLVEARDALAARGEDLPRVHLGAEVHIDRDLADGVRSGRKLRLAGGPYLLLELPDVFPFAPLEHLVHELLLDGTTPLLAHPERIGQLLRQPDQLRRLVELGALGQATGSSIAGDFGRPCRETTEAWLREGLLHVVASDAHDLVRRTPDLSRARAAVEQILGPGGARLVLEERPRAILEGRPVAVPPATPERPPPGWRIRLQGLLRRVRT